MLAVQMIKVLIVDDSAETRASVQQLLEVAGGHLVVGQGADGREAVAKATQLQPDCVLLDVSMPIMDGLAAAEQISLRCPNTAVVMMSVAGDPEDLRKAMTAGARDYLIKPFSADDLINATRRAVSGVRRRSEGKALETRFLMVVGPKGGVGRTTVAANVAVGLAEDGESVCLVDLNAQFGDLTMQLDLVPKQTLATLAQATSDIDRELLDGVLQEHKSGLRLLAAPARPEEAETLTAGVVNQVLNALQGAYQWVVIDAPAAVNEVVLTVWDRRPETLLVVAPDLSSVRNAGQLLQLLLALEIESTRTKLVLNRYGSQDPLSVEVIEKNLGLRVASRVPADPEVMRKAATMGTPVIVGDPRSGSGRAFRFLVDSLQGKEPPTKRTRHIFGLTKREARWALI